LGLALSVAFSHAEASALPLLLIGLLIVVFLIFEARRYRYFNVWRARARWIETNFYAPMLRGKGSTFGEWEEVLARDYCEPQYHISLACAVGRRLRRNYSYVLVIQALAYVGKIAIHPTPVASFGEFVQRAAIGPIPGEVILAAGLLTVWTVQNTELSASPWGNGRAPQILTLPPSKPRCSFDRKRRRIEPAARRRESSHDNREAVGKHRSHFGLD